MASISGTNTIGAVQIASTWGTAVAAGTGDRLAGEFNLSYNGTILDSRVVGSGKQCGQTLLVEPTFQHSTTQATSDTATGAMCLSLHSWEHLPLLLLLP